MKTDVLLSKLRNPYGLSEAELRETRMSAADEIERLQKLNKSMNKFLTMIAETIGATVPKNAIEGINAADEMAQRIIALATFERSILVRRIKSMDWHEGQKVWDLYYGYEGTITKTYAIGEASHPIEVTYPGEWTINYLLNGKTTDSRIRVLYPIEVNEVMIKRGEG